ncbi:U3 snoRNP protein [Ascosphaera aggregata]|nr:U3 snoRNP protein [Ascosphaera aggregata]
MANASDKARFYLEQQVAELREFERKKIFTKEEIHSITTKRSSFEHKINAAGPTPADFARYAEYEMNLDVLRLKRIKRLGIKAPTYTGQRRIMFILERAVRKCPGDLGLWMQFIEYARRCKAYKKLESLFLKALRLHPMKAELWMYAARYALDEHADMTQARAYMQRGLRFCKSKREMWLGYGKLEMIYVSKIWARQRILGLVGSAKKTETEEIVMSAEDEKDEDMLKLPTLTEEDINPSFDKNDERDDKIALENLHNTPVLSGAIPIAIYEAAIKQFPVDVNPSFARSYFLMISQFKSTPCTSKVLSHVLDSLMSAAPSSPLSHISYISMPITLLESNDATFPRALGELVRRVRECAENHPVAKLQVDKELVKILKPVLDQKELDLAIRKVVESIIARAEKESGFSQTGSM